MNLLLNMYSRKKSNNFLIVWKTKISNKQKNVSNGSNIIICYRLLRNYSKKSRIHSHNIIHKKLASIQNRSLHFV